MTSQCDTTLDAVARIVSKSRSILFVTGAGISAESGVPTYRGVGGLYDVEQTEDGLPIEEILSGSMLQRNPALTWKYLAQIGESVRGATHNRAHEVVALFEQRFPRVWTLTQNVDGFHRSAGSQNLIEIHGNMRRLSCTACRYRKTVDESPVEPSPRCPECNEWLRPDVVLFGEALSDEAVRLWRREIGRGFDVVISIGASGVFPYVRAPFVCARESGAPTVEINLEQTEITPLIDYHLSMKATIAMEWIWRRVTTEE